MNLKTADIINRYKSGIKNLPRAMYKLVFPDFGTCSMCGQEGGEICGKCLAEMKRHSGVLCEKCGRSVKEKGLCPQCQKYERPYDKGAVALFYEGRAQEAMKKYKFENKLPYAKYFAEEIYKSIENNNWGIDIITAVPSHPIKVMGKLYNPPALIARKLASMMGVKYSGRLLYRKRYTKSMSLLHGIDRMEHSKKNFKKGKKECGGKNVLIIDDVSTTGATLHVCSEILKRHNAGKVYAAAACGDTHNKYYGETPKGVV